jgi:hypothetical protein
VPCGGLNVTRVDACVEHREDKGAHEHPLESAISLTTRAPQHVGPRSPSQGQQVSALVLPSGHPSVPHAVETTTEPQLTVVALCAVDIDHKGWTVRDGGWVVYVAKGGQRRAPGSADPRVRNGLSCPAVRPLDPERSGSGCLLAVHSANIEGHAVPQYGGGL